MSSVIEDFYEYYVKECGGTRSFDEVNGICESSFKSMREFISNRHLKTVIIKHLGSFQPNYWRIKRAFEFFIAKGLDVNSDLYKERFSMYNNFIKEYESKN